MTNKKIIEKAFKKVEKGYKIETPAPIDKIVEYGIYYKFIFNHDFAKAFWGDVFVDIFGKPVVPKLKGKKLYMTMTNMKPAYLYHLAMMSQEKEPLKYLEKFV